MGKDLKNLYSLDKDVLIATKCDGLQCEYFWYQIGSVANSAKTCLFSSPRNVLAGVLTNVWLNPVKPEALPVVGEAEVGVANAGFFATSKYWTIILLVAIILLIIACLVVCLCTVEGFGFKRRQMIEKTVDETYANYFWPKRGGKETRVSIEGMRF